MLCAALRPSHAFPIVESTGSATHGRESACATTRFWRPIASDQRSLARMTARGGESATKRLASASATRRGKGKIVQSQPCRALWGAAAMGTACSLPASAAALSAGPASRAETPRRNRNPTLLWECSHRGSRGGPEGRWGRAGQVARASAAQTPESQQARRAFCPAPQAQREAPEAPAVSVACAVLEAGAALGGPTGPAGRAAPVAQAGRAEKVDRLRECRCPLPLSGTA